MVESCEVGLRKPEPEIYTHTLDKLKMAAEDVVFLDDIGANVAAANKLGIETIKVWLFKIIIGVLDRYLFYEV